MFNDMSVRDYQMRTPQWTIGKNFGRSGPFGPYFMTADALPAGCKGLRLQTRLLREAAQQRSRRIAKWQRASGASPDARSLHARESRGRVRLGALSSVA